MLLEKIFFISFSDQVGSHDGDEIKGEGRNKSTS